MIYDATTLPDRLVIRADLCVVGSGAGGAAAAMVAAEAGLRVVVLEVGSFLPPSEMTQREEAMLHRLYWDGGGRTTADMAVRVHQGRGVGGSTLHNLNLCKRIPAPIRAAWERDRGIEIPWDALYEELEALLEVTSVPEELYNRHNRLLQQACETLGWAGGGLRHNRTGCVGSGFCELGCAFDGKNHAAKKLLPRLIAAGGTVLTHCQAVRVDHDDGRVRGVEALVVHPDGGPAGGEVRIEAPRVCLSASATGTAALLARSDVPDPGGETGQRLRIHPAVIVAGEFEEPVHAWRGIPQTYECTEHFDLSGAEGAHRLWIVPAFAHPVGAATMLGGIGAPHAGLMRRYSHLAVLTAMLHDHTAGQVSPDGDLRLRIDYWPDAEDRHELAFGLEACARLLVAAGAQKIILGTDPPVAVSPAEAVAAARAVAIERGRVELTAVHPMGTVPMGADPRVAAVDGRGRHHHLAGLWVADGSLFPTSIGGPPQLSIYALGLHVGRGIVAAG